MKEELSNLKKYSKIFAWVSVFIAFISGGVGFLKFAESYSAYAIFGSIFLAFLSGLLGLISKFIDKRQDELEIIFKKTKPDMDVSIKRGVEDGKFYVVIEHKNKVPFNYNFIVTTRNDKVVSGILLERPLIYPDKNITKTLHHVNIKMAQVIDDYIELRFDFRSLYAPNFPKEDLKGSIVNSQKASTLMPLSYVKK